MVGCLCYVYVDVFVLGFCLKSTIIYILLIFYFKQCSSHCTAKASTPSFHFYLCRAFCRQSLSLMSSSSCHLLLGLPRLLITFSISIRIKLSSSLNIYDIILLSMILRQILYVVTYKWGDPGNKWNSITLHEQTLSITQITQNNHAYLGLQKALNILLNKFLANDTFDSKRT